MEDAMKFVTNFVDAELEYEDFDEEALKEMKEVCIKLGISVRGTIGESDFYRIKREFIERVNSRKRIERNITKDIKEVMENNIDRRLEEMRKHNNHNQNINKEEKVMSNNTVVTNNATENNATNKEETIMNNTTQNNNATVNDVNKEGNTMNNETLNAQEEVAATNENTDEKEAAANAAKEKAEGMRERLEEHFKFITTYIKEAKDEIVKIGNMSESEIEGYLAKHSESILNKALGGLRKFNESCESGIFLHPENKETCLKVSNMIKDIKDVIDDDNKNGWGKFKDIVKAIIVWLVRLLVKVGSIVLKLGIAIIVGGIKIGCVIVTTGLRVFGIINREVVKPTVKSVKEDIKTVKDKKKAKEDAINKFEEEVFEDFEDDFEDNFEDDIDNAPNDVVLN